MFQSHLICVACPVRAPKAHRRFLTAGFGVLLKALARHFTLQTFSDRLGSWSASERQTSCAEPSPWEPTSRRRNLSKTSKTLPLVCAQPCATHVPLGSCTLAASDVLLPGTRAPLVLLVLHALGPLGSTMPRDSDGCVSSRCRLGAWSWRTEERGSKGRTSLALGLGKYAWSEVSEA